MLRKLIKVNNISVIQQNLTCNIIQFEELNFEETIIGKGGVGTVFNVVDIDGKLQSGLLLKLIFETDSITKSYETISILHDKINSHQKIKGKSIVSEYPELIGLPFLAFKAKIEDTDENIAGYLMNDLVKYDYGDFGSEEWDKLKYLSNVSVEEKLYMCYQLARGVNFLHELKFIHADLKDVSTFINLTKSQLSLIDFDGGYNYDKQGFALTIGAITEWASPLWRKIIGQGKSSRDLTSKERLDEENWNLASALFHILTGFSPFYFLKNINEETIDSYLKNNSWPYFDENSQEINRDSVEFHQSLIIIIEQLSEHGLKPLIEQFIKVFNKGHRNVSQRLSPKQWKVLLKDVNKDVIGSPKIELFTVNKNIITKKDEAVTFKWEASFYDCIYLNDKAQSLLINANEINLEDTTDVKLKVQNDFGEATENIVVKANKVNPVIEFFETSISIRTDLTPVLLSWKAANCKSVTIANICENYPAFGSVEVNPLNKIKYILKANGYFDQVSNAELEIDVELATITSFKYEINIDLGIDNVDLLWNTKNTIAVEIQPNIGEVELNGVAHARIRDKTEFIIKAKGFFNEVEHKIMAQPFPIPLMDNLFFSTPKFNMLTTFETTSIKAPTSILEAKKVNHSYFKKLEIDHIAFPTINNIPFVELNESIINKPKADKWFKSIITKVFKHN